MAEASAPIPAVTERVQEPTAVRERQTYLDVGKVLAIVAVVVIHTVGVSYQALPPGSVDWWLAALGYESSFWAVPLFVMASGALVIPRAMQMTPGAFLRARVGRLIIPILFWVPLYIVFAAAFQDGTRTVDGVLRLLASGRPYNHLYFLPLIIGLYLVTPVIAPALRDASRTFLWAAAFGALAVGAVDTLLSTLGIGGLGMNLVTWWIPFLGYYLLGHAISTSTTRIGRALGLILVVLAIAAQLLAAWIAATEGGLIGGYMGGYLTVTTIAMSIAVFVALREWVAPIGPVATSRWAHLSRLTFGVYLGHLLVAVAIMHFLHIDGTSVLVVYLVAAVTAVVSFVAAEVASRFAIGHRLIGY